MEMVKVSSLLETPPDVLPMGSTFNFEAVDAGAVLNEECGIAWTKPGEFIQYHLWNEQCHIRIMRIATFSWDVEYCVLFGQDLSRPLGPRMSLEELKAVICEYVGGLYVE